jgi:nucleotide-binding universal stress UspA family protein
MIVVERHAGAHRAKWLLTYTDWEVLRTAPCPVLIVKALKPYHRPSVLAPIDPLHAYAKPTRLDAEILRTADIVRKGLRGRLHALYAYSPPAVLTGGFTAGAMPIPIEVSLGSADEARAELRAEIERLGIASVTEHVERASPVSAIPAVARSTGAAITVMGAISRSGLKRMFIGNTAELVLDQLQCDVLVVKPQNFKVRTPRAIAGMRLMASPLAPR